MGLDLIIRNGTVVTAADSYRADIGIAGGRIAALGADLPKVDREIDATDLLVMPGGVDAHCHVDEPAYRGARLADDFASATRAAACGGTTTILPFVNQLPGRSLRAAVADYHARAEGKALIDYAFHIILSDAAEAVVGQELPALIEDGYRSIKVFMTYPGYMLADDRILEVMATARRHGGTVLVHAENGHCVHWLSRRLEREGRADLAAFAEAAPAAVEREATHRAITLAELTGARTMLVHVSAAEAMAQVEWAKDRGLPVMAETCPQYLIDAAEKLHEPGWEAAKYICSPPPRGGDNAERLWSGVARGSFRLLSSDHCPYRFDGSEGKRSGGESRGGPPRFHHVPPGVPGLETRLPLLFHEGVLRGRLSAEQFVALTATNPARAYGLHPRKGTLAPGADADIALWDRRHPVTIRHAALHDACDYTPYEGREVGAWPVMTLARGETVWDRGRVAGRQGRGQFLRQDPHD
jgi:dihydropyrimidinase